MIIFITFEVRYINITNTSACLLQEYNIMVNHILLLTIEAHYIDIFKVGCYKMKWHLVAKMCQTVKTWAIALNCIGITSQIVFIPIVDGLMPCLTNNEHFRWIDMLVANSDLYMTYKEKVTHCHLVLKSQWWS